MSIAAPPRFYVTGGTVPRNAPCYVERQADADLREGLLHGHFCYVLTSRQMGKSSLMVRTAARLREDGMACAVLDLTSLGQNLTEEQWYDGLLNLAGRQLYLEDELECFWLGHARLGPLQRWMRAVREVVLEHVPGRIVFFVDEIDAVRSLPFSTDEFFAAIRECYNRRGEDPALERLTFCLLGVATPSDLIRNVRATPFNIGRRIELPDFTLEEARPLAAGLDGGDAGRGGRGIVLLERVLYWTGGHPYLTQRLCQTVAEASHANHGTRPAIDEVDRQCRRLFLEAAGRNRDDNLLFVQDRLLRKEGDIAGLLTLYGQVQAGRRVEDDKTNRLASVLKLSGVVRSVGGRLVARNRIYGRVFDRQWVRQNMPDAEIRRQRAAFRKGMIRAALAAALIIMTLLALAGVAIHETRRARQATVALRVALDRAERERDRADRTAERERIAQRHAQRQAREASRRARQAQAAVHRAEAEKARAEQAQRKERQARRDALDSLWQSYRAQALVARESRRAGRRFNSLQALTRAARIRPAPELRDAAIACLALADLRTARTWEGFPSGTAGFVFDARLERYARCDGRGSIRVGRVADDREVLRLPGFGLPGWNPRFSPDGRWLAVEYFRPAPGGSGVTRVLLWDLRHAKKTLDAAGYQGHSLDFRPDGKVVALLRDRGPVTLFETESGRLLRQFGRGAFDSRLAFDPDGRRLAVSGSPEVVVYDVETGGRLATLPHAAAVYGMAWRADGRRMATACGNGHVCLWDMESARLLADMPGHESAATDVAFSKDGLLLASRGWDGRMRLWGAATGIPLFSAAYGKPIAPVFSADGRLLAGYRTGTKIGLWEIDAARECRALLADWGMQGGVRDVDFSPDGRRLAVAGEAGVRLLDTASGRETAFLPERGAWTPLFTPDGSALYVSGASGLERRAFQRAPPVSGDCFGPRQALAGRPQSWRACMTPDGRALAVIASDRLCVWRAETPGRTLEIAGHWQYEMLAISPDGRWVAAHASEADVNGTGVWDARTGRAVRTLPVPSADVAFSPDGRWLVTGTAEEYRFWRTGSWQPGPRLPRPPSSDIPGVIAFTADGRRMAVAHDRLTVRLYEVATRRPLATLEAPDTQGIRFLRFSPDGGMLAVASRGVHLWDLRLVRRRLKQMGLDCSLAPDAPSVRTR